MRVWQSLRGSAAAAPILVILASLAAGCTSEPPPGPARGDRQLSRAKSSSDRWPETEDRPPVRQLLAADPEADHQTTDIPVAHAPASDWSSPGGAPNGDGPPDDGPGQQAPRRSLADLLHVADSAATFIQDLPRLVIDEDRLAAAGIRKVMGRHLTLLTDLPSSDQIDVLPQVFDQALPQWCEYFEVDAQEQADWHMTGCLIQDKSLFRAAGLLPHDLPPFQHGFSRNYELWLYQQPSTYYQRHLLLHEGTHGFMNTVLGGCGPPWYMEGVAELLATHRWQEGRLTLKYVPKSREEVPMWGRIRLVQDEFAAGRAMLLDGVVRYDTHAHLEAEPYAWCWAAAALMDTHPAYRDRFRQLRRQVLDRDFSQQFFRLIGEDWDELAEQWQLLVANLEYGHDIVRTAVDFAPGRPLPASGASVTVAADRGWQNSRFQLDGGVAYRLAASGRYQVADEPQIWWCEPNGVSIRYYRGRPLGVLLAAVRTGGPTQTMTPLLKPIPVGLGSTLTPDQSGTLFLRINDSAGELDDNAGSLTVSITPTSLGR